MKQPDASTRCPHCGGALDFSPKVFMTAAVPVMTKGPRWVKHNTVAHDIVAYVPEWRQAKQTWVWAKSHVVQENVLDLNTAGYANLHRKGLHNKPVSVELRGLLKQFPRDEALMRGIAAGLTF